MFAHLQPKPDERRVYIKINSNGKHDLMVVFVPSNTTNEAVRLEVKSKYPAGAVVSVMNADSASHRNQVLTNLNRQIDDSFAYILQRENPHS